MNRREDTRTMSTFTRMFGVYVRNAAECETYIRDIHKHYQRYTYTQVLNACRELCTRHIEPSVDTLKSLQGDCALGRRSYIVKQFEEIIQEQLEDTTHG